LSLAEQTAVENPALRQQAKALAEAEAFAHKLDIDEDGSTRIQEYIRTLGKAEARYVRDGLRVVNQLLGAIGITFTEDRPAETPAEPDAAAPSTYEAIEIAEAVPALEEPVEAVAPEPELAPEPAPEVPEAADDVPEENEPDQPPAAEAKATVEPTIETDASADPVVEASVESDDPEFELKAVQRLIGLVNKKAGQEWFSVPATREEIDADELAALAVMHISNTKRPKQRLTGFYGNLVDGEARSGLDTFLSLTSKNISKLLTSLDMGQAPAPQVEVAPVVTAVMPTPVPESKKRASPEAVAQALHKVIEEEGERDFVLSRVESIFDKLRSRGVPTGHITADDVTHTMVEHWARLYTSANGDEETARVNSSVFWGYLVGIDLQDLVEWRAATKPDAKKGDVYNTITTFTNGLTRAYNDAFKKGEPISLFPVEGGEEAQLEAEQPIIAEVSIDLHPTAEVAPEPESQSASEPAPEAPNAVVIPLVPKAVSEAPRVAQKEHKERLEHEPPHVQVAQRYYDQLLVRGANVNLKALEEFLNPLSNSELTENKRAAAQAIREWIESVSPSFLHELEAPRRGRAAVRRLFGVGFTRAGGLPEDREPEPLWKQLRTIQRPGHMPYIQDTFHTLVVVLDALSAQSAENDLPGEVQLSRES